MAVTASKYNEILRLYDKKRLRLRHEEATKKQQIYAIVPRLKEIDDSISTICVEAAKHMLLNSGKADDYKLKLAKLKEEKNKLLDENFSKDFLSLSYDCPDCRDTGYVGNNKCHCMKKLIIDVLYEQSNLKELLNKENFSTFNLRLYKGDTVDSSTGLTPLDNISNAITTAKTFVDEFDSSYKNLFIYGNTGVGKTFLTNCIAKELMDNAYSVIYISAIKLFDILADHAFNKQNVEAFEQYTNIFDCDLLIIDDLGTELVNNFTASQFFNCINQRFLNHKPIIISTNLSLSDIRATYSERVFSRITSDYTLIKIFGDDLRMKKVLE